MVPKDWDAFLTHHVADVTPRADLNGIQRGGYRLTYAEQPSLSKQTFSDPANPLYAGRDFWYSLGSHINENGVLLDVRWNSLAVVPPVSGEP